MKTEIKVVLLPGAKAPVHAHQGDAGADLFAYESATVDPGSVVLISTGIKVAVPEGKAMFILPRSNMGKKKIKVANSPGLIDSTYRGTVFVAIHNESDAPFVVDAGDRIGQAVIVDYYEQAYDVVNTLDETERGEKGFGGTGK